jgi:YggT family protein
MYIWLVSLIVNILTLLVFAHVLLSYFMSPFHPVREAIDRIIEPMLRPIRRIMPATGMIDFSPVVLLILIQLLGWLLTNI